MAHEKIRIVLFLSRRQLKAALAFVLMAGLVYVAGSETLTLVASYPSPVGIYNKIISTGLTILARDNNSRVGIGTANPSQTLDVAGAIRVGDSSTPASGSIRFNSQTNEFEGFRNNAWSSLGGSSNSGAVMFFDLASCPAGWTELTNAQGRYLVGLRPGGTLDGTAGTALSNLENRPAGLHSHPVTLTDPGHSHDAPYNHCIGYSGAGTVAIPTEYASVTIGDREAVYRHVTGISVAVNNGPAGAPLGTNAPYLQLLVCKKL